jgi:hypothetical protein
MNGPYAYLLSLSNGFDADAWRKIISEIYFKYTDAPNLFTTA